MWWAKAWSRHAHVFTISHNALQMQSCCAHKSRDSMFSMSGNASCTQCLWSCLQMLVESEGEHHPPKSRLTLRAALSGMLPWSDCWPCKDACPSASLVQSSLHPCLSSRQILGFRNNALEPCQVLRCKGTTCTRQARTTRAGGGKVGGILQAAAWHKSTPYYL